MRFLKALITWQFWTSIVVMVLAGYGLYHFIFTIWLDAYTNHNEEIEIPDLAKLKIQDAIAQLDELGLTYEIDSVKYDSTKPSFAILDYYPQKGFKVKEGRRIFIKSNPKTWRPTTLPDIVGKSKRLAFTQLKLAGLEVGDTIYEPDLAKDAVLRVLFQGKQIGKSTELPRFAKVDIVLGKGLEYGVKMPGLVGMSFEQAKSSILANRFDVGLVTVNGAVTDSALLKVYYQYPITGDNYDQGLPVDLWLTEKDPKDLESIIKELDRQYKNFEKDDSTAVSVYEHELKAKGVEDKSANVKPKEQYQLPKNTSQEQPDGVEIE